MPRIAKKSVFEPKTFTVAGQAYEDTLVGFRIKPVSKRKKGYGLQYTFTVESAADFSALVDRMAEKAADLADEIGADHPRVEGIYKQMDHIL